MYEDSREYRREVEAGMEYLLKYKYCEGVWIGQIDRSGDLCNATRAYGIVTSCARRTFRNQDNPLLMIMKKKR